MDGQLILVTGATGQQGGAVARRLLGRGFAVRGLTRDVDSDVARELTDLGAEMVEGDLTDYSSLMRALAQCYGVFSMQDYWEHGYEGEVLQGKLLADAARESEIQHFCYSSVGGAERRSGIAHFESKWEIEQHIRQTGLPWTILRPVWFMENVPHHFTVDLESRIATLSLPLPPDRPLQMIAVDDIGYFASEAFYNPDDWIGTELEIAGDELTMAEVAQIVSELTASEARYVPIPMWQAIQENEERAAMYDWFAREGYQADIAALREINPGLLTFRQWVEVHSWTPVMTDECK